MGTNENKELVRRFISRVLQDLDPDSVDELVGEEFVSHTWNFKGEAKEGLKQITGVMAKALSDIDFEIEDLIAEGDQVVARVTSSATQSGEFHDLPPSGKRYTIGEIHIFRIADGKIAEHWHQYDGLSLMSQLKSS